MGEGCMKLPFIIISQKRWEELNANLSSTRQTVRGLLESLNNQRQTIKNLHIRIAQLERCVREVEGCMVKEERRKKRWQFGH